MSVRVFSSGRITLDEGTLDTFRTNGLLAGAVSFVATFKRSGSTGDGTQYIFSLNANGSVRCGLSYTSGSVMQFEIGGTARTFTGLTLTNDTNYTSVVRKANGTATPQMNLLNHTTGTWSGWTNATGTLDNDTEVLDEMQIGNRPNDFPINGKITGIAAFAYLVSDVIGVSFGVGVQYWANAQPVGMWLLTQSTVSAVNDVSIGGTANQTASTGTSVDNDNPSNFNLTFETGAPTLLDYASSAYASGSPRVTDDLDWMANGDRIISLCATEDNGVLQGTPSATGLTLAALSGTPTNTASSCKAYGWSATASGDGNSTLSSTQSGNSGSAGLSAWAFKDSASLGTAVVAVSTALVNSVTVEDNSSVVMVLADWNAAVASAPVLTPAGGILRVNTNVNGAATFLVAEWHAQTAGTRNYGVSSGWSGTGTVSKIATEVKGTASGTTEVSSDLDLRWVSRGQVTSDLDLRWRSSIIVTSDHDLRWATKTIITSDHDLRWRVANIVTSDLDVRWRSFSRVLSDFDARWVVLGRVTLDHDLRWLSRSQVTADHDFRWRSVIMVNSDHDFRWVVDSTVLVVNSDLDLRWRVSQRVNSDLSLPWLVRERVQSDHDLRWRMWSVVTSDHDLRWLVFNAVVSSLDLRWVVRAQVNSDLTVRWIVLSLVVPTPDAIVSLAVPVVTVDLTTPYVEVP
jgi:hypothetical protein